MASEVLPLRKGGAEFFSHAEGGGGHNKFSGSFYEYRKYCVAIYILYNGGPTSSAGRVLLIPFLCGSLKF